MNTRLGYPNNLLKQTAVLWTVSTTDGYAGRTYAAGVAIIVRWLDKQELFIDSQGREVRSQAVVIVDRAIATGSYLYLGTLASLSAGQQADPKLVATAREVRAVSAVPNARATATVRKVWL